MDNSDVSLALAPCHLSLPTTSHSFLSPSSALLPNLSESSHQNHHQYPPQDQKHEKSQRKPFKSTLMDSLRYRFPDGRPPRAYDEFIQVTLNDVPPDSALVDNVNASHQNEPLHLSPVQRLQRMTSRVFATISASAVSRPPLPLHNPRPVISYPRPMEASAGVLRGRKPRTPSPSPVQFYTQAFNGVGPPAPLPSPSDIVDIRPSSRNTASRSQSASRSHSACSHTKNRMPNDLRVPDVPCPEPVQLATKNSIIFPRVHEDKHQQERHKARAVRIITPRRHGASYIPHATTPMQEAQATQSSTFLASLSLLSFWHNLHARFLRIITFSDPAESLFHLGFVTGPQTWLLGGWYLTSTSTSTSADMKDAAGKSQLRVWVDKHVHVERTGSTGHGGDLLDRIECMERAEREQGQRRQGNASSSGLTSSSFEIGRRTATDSNASRLHREMVPPANEAIGAGVDNNFAPDTSMIVLPHFRSSRAVWSASKMGVREYAGHTYGRDGASDIDEISIHLEQSLWVYRCRIAAFISGLVVMSLFISALTVVCVR